MSVGSNVVAPYGTDGRMGTILSMPRAGSIYPSSNLQLSGMTQGATMRSMGGATTMVTAATNSWRDG
jgi:hypothetical protein